MQTRTMRIDQNKREGTLDKSLKNGIQLAKDALLHAHKQDPNTVGGNCKVWICSEKRGMKWDLCLDQPFNTLGKSYYDDSRRVVIDGRQYLDLEPLPVVSTEKFKQETSDESSDDDWASIAVKQKRHKTKKRKQPKYAKIPSPQVPPAHRMAVTDPTLSVGLVGCAQKYGFFCIIGSYTKEVYFAGHEQQHTISNSVHLTDKVLALHSGDQFVGNKVLETLKSDLAIELRHMIDPLNRRHFKSMIDALFSCIPIRQNTSNNCMIIGWRFLRLGVEFQEEWRPFIQVYPDMHHIARVGAIGEARNAAYAALESWSCYEDETVDDGLFHVMHALLHATRSQDHTSGTYRVCLSYQPEKKFDVRYTMSYKDLRETIPTLEVSKEWDKRMKQRSLDSNVVPPAKCSSDDSEDEWFSRLPKRKLK